VPATSGAEADDQAREASAYNVNIYIMVAAPYLLLGAVGFLVYRGLRHMARNESLPDAAPPDGPGGRSCPPPSAPGDVS
jgi:hypothetical protein